jgi:hypothetical protein
MDLALKNEILNQIICLVDSKKFSEITTDSLDEIFIGLAFVLRITYTGNFLYRAIKYDEKPKELDKLIYPPIEKARKNRVNNEGEQLFYCAGSKFTALYEVNVSKNDRIVIGTWLTQDRIMTNSLGFTKSIFTYTGTDKYETTDNVEPSFFAPENYELIEKLGILFCQDNFEDNDKYYDLTIALAKKTYGGNIQNLERQLDGIMYPSIKNNGIDHNLALFPKVIDDKALILDKVEYIEIINSDEYLLLDYAENVAPNGNIDWAGLNKKYLISAENHEYVFIDNNGEFICYDYEGNVINPF